MEYIQQLTAKHPFRDSTVQQSSHTHTYTAYIGMHHHHHPRSQLSLSLSIRSSSSVSIANRRLIVMEIVEVVMMVQVEGIVRMIGLDDRRRMIGLDNGRMHHRLHHCGQDHGLDDVMRDTVHHRWALVGDGGRQVDDLGHVQRLHMMMVVRIKWVLRIVVMVAVQEARTCRRQGADGEQWQYLGDRR